MTRVTLGGLDLTVEAARLQPGTWNGFARPLFDRVNAVVVADYFESMAAGPNGEDGERMFAIRDYFLVVDPNNPEYSHVVRPDDDGLYDFGDGYQWEELSAEGVECNCSDPYCQV